MRRFFANAGVALISLVVSVLLVEGVLRLVTDRHVGSPENRCDDPMYRQFGIALDPVFAWRNQPGAAAERCPPEAGEGVAVDVNRLGFRGAEVSARKPEGTLRIVCMGDSGTFGVQAVKDPNSPIGIGWRAISSYPSGLAERLAEEGRRDVEVINAGVVGYSSSHGLRLLLLRVLDLEPDIVTVRFAANDASPAWGPERRAAEPRHPLPRTLLYAFHGWRLMRLGLAAYQGVPSQHPEPDSVFWSTPDDFRWNHERMVEETRERGVRLLFMDYPRGPPGPDRLSSAIENRMPELERILAEVAAETGTPLLVTAPHLEGRAEPMYNVIDRVHPNDRGARRIADLLFEELDALGWLEPR